MFRNQYDTDVVTWSPQGRIHQIEYAMEAVKQGSAAVGLKSETHVVLATLKRAPSELSSFARKIFKIDDHLGIAASGLASDGRVLCRYMRNECLNHQTTPTALRGNTASRRFVFESPMPVGRLVRQVADKGQVATQRSWKRPFGVGLLVAGYDQSGAKLYYNCPSGNFYEYMAFAIGARSQAAKTYLERKFESFAACSVDELIAHGLRALSSSVADGELTPENCTVAVVGKGLSLLMLEGDALKPHIDSLKAEEAGDDEAPAAGEQPAAAGEAEPAAEGDGGPSNGDGAAPMES